MVRKTSNNEATTVCLQNRIKLALNAPWRNRA